jgi:drug/metabolite transporter (DMT)-like permease
MPRKSHVDAFGIISLTGFALLLGFNQVVIKVTNDGLQPVFFAALRSLGGAVLIYAWIRWRRIDLTLPRSTWGAGVLIGTVFAFEFVCLFLALDYTPSRAHPSCFYTMPIWLALAAHVLIPGERLTVPKSIGLALAFAGRGRGLARAAAAGGRDASGDLLALGAAIFWAAHRADRAHDRAENRQRGGAASVATRGLGADPAAGGRVLRPVPARSRADPLGGAGLPDRGRRLGGVPVLVLASDDLPGVVGGGLRVPLADIRREPRLADPGRAGRPRHPGRAGAGLRRGLS